MPVFGLYKDLIASAPQHFYLCLSQFFAKIHAGIKNRYRTFGRLQKLIQLFQIVHEREGIWLLQMD